MIAILRTGDAGTRKNSRSRDKAEEREPSPFPASHSTG